MFRSDRHLIALSCVTVAALGAVAAAAAVRSPPGTMLPTHWNAAGEADGFAEAATALFLPVVLTGGLSLIMALLPRIEPLQQRMAGSRGLFATVWVGLLAVMASVELMVAASAFGRTLPPSLPLLVVGALFLLLGNALPKSRPGFFVGIRTPWALIDTDNWIATHRLGGRVMMAAGGAIVAAALLPIAAPARSAAVIAAIAAVVVVPYAYSWWRWRRVAAG